MSGTKTSATTLAVEPQQVVEFLQQHPMFFTEYEALLDELFIPHPTGGAVSLLERLVQRQRQRHTDLEQRLTHLMSAAHNSERMVTGLHTLAVELLRCHTLEQVVKTCSHIIRDEFKAHIVAFRLIGSGESHEGLNFISPDDHRALKQLSHLFTKRQPVCGRLRPKQQEFLFGKQGDVIKSAVLIPLFEHSELGVLALGSDDEARYYPGMGTLFINQLGALVSSALAHHVTPLPLNSAESAGH